MIQANGDKTLPVGLSGFARQAPPGYLGGDRVSVEMNTSDPE